MSRRRQEDEDAALARSLQQQFDSEEIGAQASAARAVSDLNQAALAANGNDTLPSLRDQRASSQIRQANQQRQFNEQAPPAVATSTDQDLALARQLAAQEHVQATAQALQVAHHQQNGNGGMSNSNNNATVMNNSGRREYDVTDEPSSWLDMPNEDNYSHAFTDTAKRQQEYEDSRTAQRLQEEEQNRAIQQDLQLQQQRRGHQEVPRKSCLRRTAMTTFISMLAVGIVVAILVVFNNSSSDSSAGGFRRPGGPIGGPGITDKDFIDNDPQYGERDPIPWFSADGINGLDMIVMNALDAEWYPFFYKAVSDWDDSDALRLETQVEPYDFNCTAVPGFIKVCSGNYGNSSWRGLNEVGVLNGRITSSRARMNEYYINPAESGPTNDPDRQFIQDEAQYVMCHELGHALGLVHTDEDFDNQDTFNCLDYTRNPGLNQEPGQVNFDVLESLYGTVAGSDSGGTGASGGNRQRKRSTMERKTNGNDWLLSKETRDVYDAHSGTRLQPHLWTELHRSRHAEVHEVSLSNGRSLRVQKLLY